MDLAWAGINQVMRATDWVASVHASLAAFDATLHHMTNVDIVLDGMEATARAQMTARHVLTIDGVSCSHLIGGYYHHALRKIGEDWKITTLGLTISWEQGDRSLFQRAAVIGLRLHHDVGVRGMLL